MKIISSSLAIITMLSAAPAAFAANKEDAIKFLPTINECLLAVSYAETQGVKYNHTRDEWVKISATTAQMAGLDAIEELEKTSADYQAKLKSRVAKTSGEEGKAWVFATAKSCDELLN